MKLSIKIMLCVILGLVAILALSLIQGNFVQGLMRPAYNENKCYDSDGGQKYDVKGTTYGKMSVRNSKTQFTDSCDGNTLVEYYCEKNNVAEKKENGGIKKECSDGKLANGAHVPELPTYPLGSEKSIEPVILSAGNYTVIVPQGYEKLGQKHLEDLEHCGEIIPQFLGINDPYWDKVILKIYVSNNDEQASYAYPPEGILYYERTQEYIDDDLGKVINNDPEGFLYNSGPTYCANTHELTHVIVAFTPVPAWADEGIAEYAQKNNQQGSKDHFLCGENAWYGIDYWDDDQYKKFNYSDLSKTWGDEPGLGSAWYHTAMCFWEHFDEKFG